MMDLTARLLAFLEDQANAGGLAMARELPLEEHLQCTREELVRAVAEIESTGKGRILSRLPFLAIRFTSWPNHRENGARASRAPYSFKCSLSQSRLNSESYSHRDTLGSEALLQDILTTLGESDPTTFRGALDAYSPEAIRQTLERIRTMKRITKSRTALFRYLLPRIAKESKTAA